MLDGWILVHRCLLDKPIWFKSTLEQKVILITLLLMASHKESEWEWMGKKFKIKPGQFVTSLDSIVNRCGEGVSVRNVRTALARFEKLEFLTNKSTKTGRLITIVNWELYQPKSEDLTKKVTKTRQRPDKDLTPINKDIYIDTLSSIDTFSNKDPSVSQSMKSSYVNSDKKILEKIFKAAGIEYFRETTAIFIRHVMTMLWEKPILATKIQMDITHQQIRDRLILCRRKHLDAAIARMENCKTNKEIYFAKCLLTAIVERGIEEMFEEE